MAVLDDDDENVACDVANHERKEAEALCVRGTVLFRCLFGCEGRAFASLALLLLLHLERIFEPPLLCFVAVVKLLCGLCLFGIQDAEEVFQFWEAELLPLKVFVIVRFLDEVMV